MSTLSFHIYAIFLCFLMSGLRFCNFMLFVYIHQYNIRTNLLYLTEMYNTFIVCAKQVTDASLTGNNDIFHTARTDIDFQVRNISEFFTRAYADDFFILHFR
jgi:hypothetical protein